MLLQTDVGRLIKEKKVGSIHRKSQTEVTFDMGYIGRTDGRTDLEGRLGRLVGLLCYPCSTLTGRGESGQDDTTDHTFLRPSQKESI